MSDADCQHTNLIRVARFYFQGRPLYECQDCGARVIDENDEPSYKGLASLAPGSPAPGTEEPA